MCINDTMNSVMLEVTHLVTHSKNYWRNIKLSELSELYISMTLKTFAFSLVGVFVPVYLYQLGYSLTIIALYYFWYFICRIPINYLAGELVARYGPKHTLSYAYVLNLVYLGMLLTLPEYNWPLVSVAFLSGASISIFFVAYHVDFSKIKKRKEEGAELGHMYLLSRLAGASGPILGGIIATLVGVHVVLIISIVVMLLAIIPLMMTGEPTPTNVRPDYSKINWRKEIPNYIAFAGTGIARQVTLALWPLYLGVFIFTDGVYGLIGLVTSVSVVASILMAKFVGSTIDNDKSGALLRWSAAAGTLVHLFRTVVSSLWGIIGINIAGEMSETGILLPLTKGYYDAADSEDRVAYITTMEIVGAITRAFFWLLVALLFMTVESQLAFRIAIVVAALATPLVLLNNFKAIQVKR